MKRIIFAAAAAGLIAPFGLGSPAMADPGDNWREQWKIRAECERKLSEAKNGSDFRSELRECNKKMSEWSGKERAEAIKSWQRAEKKWRERWRDHDDD